MDHGHDGLPDDLVPVPAVGRRYRTTRLVRLGDADRHGRLRLDALARMLQDVGNDDFADAGLDPSSPWVARRTVVWSTSWPRIGAKLGITTFCGGLGSRWGERRSSLRAEDGGGVEVASLWVFLGAEGTRPTPLPDWFVDTYGEAARGRTVGSRLRHPAPPPDGARRPWPLRATDLDVLGHVNNAATWQAVEDEAARRDLVPRRAELEYRAALEPTDEVVLVAADEPGGGFRLWLTVDGAVRASALVT